MVTLLCNALRDQCIYLTVKYWQCLQEKKRSNWKKSNRIRRHKNFMLETSGGGVMLSLRQLRLRHLVLRDGKDRWLSIDQILRRALNTI